MQNTQNKNNFIILATPAPVSHKTAEENLGLGNYNYKILDDRAKIAYDALKRWHTVHMAFYDKAIDPLTSPKALTKSEMADFYAEYLKIRQLD